MSPHNRNCCARGGDIAEILPPFFSNPEGSWLTGAGGGGGWSRYKGLGSGSLGPGAAESDALLFCACLSVCHRLPVPSLELFQGHLFSVYAYPGAIQPFTVPEPAAPHPPDSLPFRAVKCWDRLPAYLAWRSQRRLEELCRRRRGGRAGE